jgi:hypothetical protein
VPLIIPILKKEPDGVWLFNVNLKIWHDGTKWRRKTSSGNYAVTNGKVQRASITILPEAKGKTNIANSEIDYLRDSRG